MLAAKKIIITKTRNTNEVTNTYNIKSYLLMD